MPNEKIRQARRFGRAAKDRVAIAMAAVLAEPSQKNTYFLSQSVKKWEFALRLWRVEADRYVAHSANPSPSVVVVRGVEVRN